MLVLLQFFTDVNVGSDSETGGYVMAKHNSSKTCDDFVDDVSWLGPAQRSLWCHATG